MRVKSDSGFDQEEKATFLSDDKNDGKGEIKAKTVIDTEKKEILNNKDTRVEINVKSKGHIKLDRSTGWRQYTGLILAVLSSLLFSIVLVLVKALRVYHPFSTSMWRQLGNVIPSVPLVLYFRYWKKENIFEHVWPLNTKDNKDNVIGLAGRAFLGSTAIILKFSALQYLEIADTTVISYSGPIFIVIMAHFYLKEKCGVTPIVVGIWTLLGVALIARPPFLTGQAVDMNILIGTGIIFTAVLFQSAVAILVRKIRKIHFSVMTLAFGLWGFFQSLIVSLAFGVLSVPVGLADIGLTALLGILSFFAQMCAIMSLKFEQAGPVSLIRTIDVLFAFIWQIVIFGVIPDTFSVLGATVVMMGVILIAIRKWIGTLPEENRTRKTLGCLLR